MTTTTPPAPFAGSARDLEAGLARERDLEAVRRRDELERTAGRAAHERALADLAEGVRSARAERAEREESRSADAKLRRVFLRARDAGERTRLSAHLARSGEARALRLAKLRTLNLRVLVPVLGGFAAWSTTGVQAGAARLMAVSERDPMWWALWVLEPVLIGAVVWVIIARARLAACGGRLSDRAVRIAAGCLGTSIVLNLIAAAPGTGSTGWAGAAVVVGAMLAHLIGPLGAAATAHLIGVVDESITDADPWTERGRPVPLLADMHTLFDRTPEGDRAGLPAGAGGGQAATAAPPNDSQEAADGVTPPVPSAEVRAVIERTQAELDAFLAEVLGHQDDGQDDGPGPAHGPGGGRRATTMLPPGSIEVPPGSIDRDQREDTTGVVPAARARLAIGASTRARIGAYQAAHPEATTAQIAAAVGVSDRTVRTARRALRDGDHPAGGGR